VPLQTCITAELNVFKSESRTPASGCDAQFLRGNPINVQTIHVSVAESPFFGADGSGTQLACPSS
jgi:hypothetical protein